MWIMGKRGLKATIVSVVQSSVASGQHCVKLGQLNEDIPSSASSVIPQSLSDLLQRSRS